MFLPIDAAFRESFRVRSLDGSAVALPVGSRAADVTVGRGLRPGKHLTIGQYRRITGPTQAKNRYFPKILQVVIWSDLELGITWLRNANRPGKNPGPVQIRSGRGLSQSSEIALDPRQEGGEV